jgi:toxin HigB-1
MIVSFRDAETAQIWDGRRSRRLPPDISKPTALRKLRLINNARQIDDLAVPPGNRLEALRGKRTGQHSIRINNQWRIRFIWKDGCA